MAAELHIPKEIWMDELNALPFQELLERSEALGVKVNPERTRHHLVYDLLRAYAAKGAELYAEGVIDLSQPGIGYLRWPRFNFRPLPQDVYVPSQMERQFFLRNGHSLTARIRPPGGRERFLTVEKVLKIEGIPAEEWQEPAEFDKLTALHPTDRIVLEHPKPYAITSRAIDLIAPLGAGSAASSSLLRARARRSC